MHLTRAEARSLGLKRFFSGDECPRGHVSERLVSNGTCVACSKSRLKTWWQQNHKRPEEPLSKAQAILSGLKYFNTGRPCIRGHTADRRISDGKCRECARIKTRARRLRNPDYAKESIKRWEKNNPEAKRAHCSKRRALKLLSSDHYTKSDVKQILIIQKSKCISCSTKIEGGNYHVDHIMPLFLGGDNSRKNIQILCPSCNLKKGAKHPVDWALENGRLV